MLRFDYPLWSDGTYPSQDGTWSDFYVIANTNMPVILTENFFFTTPADLELLLDPNERTKMAVAHAKTAVRYFGLKYPEVVKSANTEEGLTMSEFKGMLQDALDEMRDYEVSDWAEKDWEEAELNNYFDGSAPKAFLTRQEAAVVINRLRHNFKALIKRSVEEAIAEHEAEKHAE
jgi:hypothetical protein